MDSKYYCEVKLSDGRMIEVILVKTSKGFIGVASDSFFIGVYAKNFEEAKRLFIEAYEEYNVIEVVWD